MTSDGISPAIWTVGHSTRSLTEFIELLEFQSIELLADVRSYPVSRRHPHFNKDRLNDSLKSAGIEYVHLRELGGLRKPLPESHNTAWQNPGFRGYADYMETEEFRGAVDRLLALAASKRTAMMCAEALWWRCHRSLISDYLKSHGAMVHHILNQNRVELHPYTTAASIVDGGLSYRGLLDHVARRES